MTGLCKVLPKSLVYWSRVQRKRTVMHTVTTAAYHNSNLSRTVGAKFPQTQDAEPCLHTQVGRPPVPGLVQL